MLTIVSTKECKLSEKQEKIISRFNKKLERFLKFIPASSMSLSITLKYHSKKDYYRGTFILVIPKKTFTVRDVACDIESLLHDCFSKLQSDISKFKGKKFRSHTEYPDRETIRVAEIT